MPDSSSSLASAKLPVDTYEEAALHLRRPFTPEAVKWKVQAGTLVVPYIDARLVIERLNKVVPGNWFEGDPEGSPPFESIAGGKGLLCRLTVFDIPHCDVGSGYEGNGKGLYSDAFKRAAVKHGVGVSLYALPKVFLSFDEAQLTTRTFKTKKGEERKVTELTDKGRARLDSGYRAWLKGTGEELFGPPLDHGDVAESFGDVEAEAPTEEATSAAEAEPEKLDDAKAKALIAGAESLYKELPKSAKGAKGLTPAAFRRALESASHSHDQLEKLCADLEKRKEAAA